MVLANESKGTEAAAITVAQPTTETVAPATTAAVIAVYLVAVITGVLHWVAPDLRDGCRSIAIARDDETELDADGRPLLTGVRLTKSMSARFDEAHGESIFVHETRLSITIRTENLEADLASGKGRSHSRKPYFVGQAVECPDIDCLA